MAIRGSSVSFDDLQDLPGYTSDPTLCLRANFTWQAVGGTTMPQLAMPVLSTSNITATSVSLSWSTIANATSYVLEYYDGAVFQHLSTQGVTTYNATGLTTGTNYTWRVKAVASGYIDSNYSSVSAIPSAAPGPTNVNLLGNSHLFHEWSSSAVSFAYQSANNGGILAPDGTDDITRVTSNGQFSSFRYANPAYTYANSTQYTYWVDFKAGTTAGLRVQLNLGSDKYVSAIMNGSTGTITKEYEDVPLSVSIVSLGTGQHAGWYRGTMTFNTPPLSGTIDVSIEPRPSTEVGGETVLLWKNQVNTGATPLTYQQKP